MMGIVVPETCWAYKKYNKIISGTQMVFILQLSQWCTVQQISDAYENLTEFQVQEFINKNTFIGGRVLSQT